MTIEQQAEAVVDLVHQQVAFYKASTKEAFEKHAGQLLRRGFTPEEAECMLVCIYGAVTQEYTA